MRAAFAYQVTKTLQTTAMSLKKEHFSFDARDFAVS